MQFSTVPSPSQCKNLTRLDITYNPLRHRTAPLGGTFTLEISSRSTPLMPFTGTTQVLNPDASPFNLSPQPPTFADVDWSSMCFQLSPANIASNFSNQPIANPVPPVLCMTSSESEGPPNVSDSLALDPPFPTTMSNRLLLPFLTTSRIRQPPKPSSSDSSPHPHLFWQPHSSHATNQTGRMATRTRTTVVTQRAIGQMCCVDCDV